MAVQYTLFPSNPSAHIFTVTLFVEHPNPNGQVLTLPTWIPGSYMIREFSKNIVEMSAKVGERSVPVEQILKNSWRVMSEGQPFALTYTVYAWDLSVRMAHLDQTHGYCNGTSVFLSVEGQEQVTHRVLIQAPTDPLCQGWKIATTLKSTGSSPYDFGWFEAGDYDELIDHPIEMGTFELLTFEACGVPHEIAVTGVVRYDRERLVADLKAICEAELQFFGLPAPMERYLFQVMALDSGYGGLEHRSSTSLICSKESLPWGEERSAAYQNFLGLCAHEYFHTWNVKRIKPAVYLPYNLNEEAYTTLLWVFEGWTSYYDDLTLFRTGLLTEEEYLRIVAKTITRVYKGSALHKQSLADSSFTTWIKFYRQDENAPNSVVSYYAKGALAAMALDLHIRNETEDRKSLDDVMKALWTRFGLLNIGVPEAGVESLTQEITGLDLSSWFDTVVRGVGELPLEELFSTVGITLCSRLPSGLNDLGGAPSSQVASVHLGCSLEAGAVINQVFDGGTAQVGGLASGDVLLALDGIKITKATVEKMLQRYSVGDVVEIHFFRRDELMVRNVTLCESPFRVHYIQKVQDDAKTERRERWLSGRN